MTDDISAIAARMREEADEAKAANRPTTLAVVTPDALLDLLDDWERRGKERDEARESSQFWKESSYSWEKRSAHQMSEAAALTARVAELEEALEPFAAYCKKRLSPNLADDHRIRDDDGDVIGTAGDLRRARAVLAKKGEG